MYLKLFRDLVLHEKDTNSTTSAAILFLLGLQHSTSRPRVYGSAGFYTVSRETDNVFWSRDICSYYAQTFCR